MSPTSYQAAPPRVIDTTRLAVLLQPPPRQVPDSVLNSGTLTLKLLHVLNQGVHVDVQSCSNAAVPQNLGHHVAGTPACSRQRTCAGTCANDSSQLSASRVVVSSTHG
jgi:hypothetical protein